MSKEEEEESSSSEEIKPTIEQWKWPEMQGLELVVTDNNNNNINNNDATIYVSHSHQHPTLTSVTEKMETCEPNNKEDGDDEGKKKNKKDAVPSVGFGQLFRFADGLDYILMTIGTIGTIWKRGREEKMKKKGQRREGMRERKGKRE